MKRWTLAALGFVLACAQRVPDIDRTHFFLCVGANPAVSNGSFMTAPNARRRDPCERRVAYLKVLKSNSKTT